MNCIICGELLNKSQYAEGHTLKSCPRCSVQDGKEHIYWAYSGGYGTSSKRITVNIPDGAQSHCTEHRGNRDFIKVGGRRCSEVNRD